MSTISLITLMFGMRTKPLASASEGSGLAKQLMWELGKTQGKATQGKAQ